MNNCKPLAAVGGLAFEQSSGKSSLLDRTDQRLIYINTHKSPSLRFWASDMLFRSYTDASYHSVYGVRSRAGEYNFFDWIHDPWRLNGGISAKSTIMDVVVSSATEAEYGGAFMNAWNLVWLRVTASELGYPQGKTEIYCDNEVARGMRKSKAMNMRLHCLRDRIKQGHFQFTYVKSRDNIAGIFTKSLPATEFKRQVARMDSSIPTAIR